MKSIALLSLLFLAAIARPQSTEPLNFHTRCEEPLPCKEIKYANGEVIKVTTEPALSVTPEMVIKTTRKKNAHDEEQFLLQLDDAGASGFEKLTRENVGKTIAVAIGDLVLINPIVQEPIPGGQLYLNLDFLKGVPETHWLKLRAAEARSSMDLGRYQSLFIVLGVALVFLIGVCGLIIWLIRRSKSVKIT